MTSTILGTLTQDLDIRYVTPQEDIGGQMLAAANQVAGNTDSLLVFALTPSSDIHVRGTGVFEISAERASDRMLQLKLFRAVYRAINDTIMAYLGDQISEDAKALPAASGTGDPE